jgi:NAD(P)-dependent dehydrogenase (short-subunit alcohol dehydrogenase family)
LAGGSATFFKADITKPEQIAAFIAFTHEKFGHIDFAVNNAGIAGKNARLDIFDEKYLLTSDDAIFNNLYGGVHLVRAEAKYWMEHGDPTKTYSIVLLSSYNGIRGCQGCDLYSASKHGLIGIVRSSAQSFSQTTPRIRINGVAPGLINTFLTRNQVKPDPDAGEAIREDNPLWIEAKP